MRWFILFCFFLLFTFQSAEAITVDRDAVLYKRGVQQFKIGSYSTALDYFLKLLKPGSKYYSKSLLMLAKTYYAIGRKTGNKKFFWQALNYLQLYFISVGNRELPWDYYYTKAKIYEALSFYEQALAVYRVAFLAARTPQQKIDTTIGIVRTAVWSRRNDIVDEYFILVSTSKLNPQEEKEVEFLKGLILFSQGKYRDALPYFFKLYKEFEDFLIDNPEYYLLVAEDIYRTGNLTLAEQVFRRIASLTKDPAVVRKAVLRLGDIELKRGNKKLAFVYYYSVIRDYPNSTESFVARLKIIPMMKDPDIKYRALLTGDKAFKDPINYIVNLLVNYRTTYVGIYALADLGYLIFDIGAPPNVFRRLLWEVSLVFPQQVKYEQREFLRYLWKPYLLKLPPKKGCELYRANPQFFQEIFGKEVLLKFASDLKVCNQRRLRLELLSYMVNRWRDDESRLLMAEALFDDKDFSEALKVLQKVKNKNSCRYKLLYSEIQLVAGRTPLPPEELINVCGEKKRVKLLAVVLAGYSKRGNVDSAFRIYLENRDGLLKGYGNDPVVRAALDDLLQTALLKENYGIALQLAQALDKAGYRNCLIDSYLTISAVRLGKLNEAKRGYTEIKGCVDSLSLLARTAYEDALLREESLGTFQTVKRP